MAAYGELSYASSVASELLGSLSNTEHGFTTDSIVIHVKYI